MFILLLAVLSYKANAQFNYSLSLRQPVAFMQAVDDRPHSPTALDAQALLPKAPIQTLYRIHFSLLANNELAMDIQVLNTEPIYSFDIYLMDIPNWKYSRIEESMLIAVNQQSGRLAIAAASSAGKVGPMATFRLIFKYQITGAPVIPSVSEYPNSDPFINDSLAILIGGH